MTETSCWSVWCPRRSWDAEAGGLSLLAVRPSVPGTGSLHLPVNCPDLVCSVLEKLVTVVPVKPLVNCGHGTSWWEFGPVLTMAQLFTLFCAMGSSSISDCMRQLFRHVETFFSDGDDLFSGLNQTGHVPPSNSFVLWKQSI